MKKVEKNFKEIAKTLQQSIDLMKRRKWEKEKMILSIVDDMASESLSPCPSSAWDFAKTAIESIRNPDSNGDYCSGCEHEAHDFNNCYFCMTCIRSGRSSDNYQNKG